VHTSEASAPGPVAHDDRTLRHDATSPNPQIAEIEKSRYLQIFSDQPC
jgi:hypothetical protein